MSWFDLKIDDLKAFTGSIVKSESGGEAVDLRSCLYLGWGGGGIFLHSF